VSSWILGKTSQTYCIEGVPHTQVGGVPACLAYRVNYYGAILPGYVSDEGYALRLLGRNQYVELGNATIAAMQQRGDLPTPMPAYSMSSRYLYGFSLWPVLALFVIVASLRRRAARRRHATSAPALDAVGTGVEVTASHNVLAFSLFLSAPAIEIDGERHPRAWGTWTFALPPGRHTIACSYRWFRDRSRKVIEVDVGPGEIKRIAYHVGLFRTSSLKLDESAPRARVEAS
jgi:hypothetical protein